MGNYIEHAKRELKAIGYIPLDQKQEDGPNKWMQENIIELLEVFSKQRHSGSSAPYCVGMFKKLALFEPLSPLTGEDWEWQEVGDGVFQNIRCSHVFKENGEAYDIEGIIFREPSGVCYTGMDSRVPVVFPYTPKSEYVDVEVVGRSELRNLLATIHRDGGHNTTKQGLILSTTEARGVVLKERAELERVKAENRRLRKIDKKWTEAVKEYLYLMGQVPLNAKGEFADRVQYVADELRALLDKELKWRKSMDRKELAEFMELQRNYHELQDKFMELAEECDRLRRELRYWYPWIQRAHECNWQGSTPICPCSRCDELRALLERRE